MNSKITVAEVRLAGVVAEARQFANQLRELRDAITKQYQDMPKSMKKGHADLVEVLRKAAALQEALDVYTKLATGEA